MRWQPRFAAPEGILLTEDQKAELSKAELIGADAIAAAEEMVNAMDPTSA